MIIRIESVDGYELYPYYLGSLWEYGGNDYAHTVDCPFCGADYHEIGHGLSWQVKIECRECHQVFWRETMDGRHYDSMWWDECGKPTTWVAYRWGFKMNGINEVV